MAGKGKKPERSVDWKKYRSSEVWDVLGPKKKDKEDVKKEN